MRDHEPQRVAVVGLERLAVGVRREQREVVLERTRAARSRVKSCSAQATAKCALGSGLASFASSRQCTPSKAVSKRLQRVTQWMSCTLLERGSALNSSQRQLDLVLDLAEDAERPGREVGARDAACVQHGPLDGHVLAGRQPAGVDPRLPDLPLLSAPEHRA